eukprot:3699572-Rhodomonas_salina.1
MVSWYMPTPHGSHTMGVSSGLGNPGPVCAMCAYPTSHTHVPSTSIESQESGMHPTATEYGRPASISEASGAIPTLFSVSRTSAFSTTPSI